MLAGATGAGPLELTDGLLGVVGVTRGVTGADVCCGGVWPPAPWEPTSPPDGAGSGAICVEGSGPGVPPVSLA